MDIEQENDDTLMRRLRLAALSGGLSGAGIGGAGALLGGAKGKGILKAAASAGLLGGASAPVGIGIGESILGAPKKGEKNANSRRGMIGGALVGGMAGAGLAGLMKNKALLSKFGSMGKKAEGLIDSDNLIFNKMRDLVNQKDKAKVAMGAGLGAGTGALVGGFHGGDEGLGVDAVENEIANYLERKQKRKMMGVS